MHTCRDSAAVRRQPKDEHHHARGLLSGTTSPLNVLLEVVVETLVGTTLPHIVAGKNAVFLNRQRQVASTQLYVQDLKRNRRLLRVTGDAGRATKPTVQRLVSLVIHGTCTCHRRRWVDICHRRRVVVKSPIHNINFKYIVTW